MSINNRIAQLRALMKERNIDAYIIPSTDSHQSEYVPAYYKGREWISGFTGSAGTVVITQDHAGLWTDSRYFLQAERELSESEFQLHKLSARFSSRHTAWLANHLGAGKVVGFDGKTITIKALRSLEKHLPKGTKMMTNYDLLKDIWENRPPLPSGEIYELSSSLSGATRKEKIGIMKEFLTAHNAQHLIIPTLDDIAWVFNIRGTDVPFNPVTVAYAIISSETSHLFVDEQKLPPLLADRLMNDDIEIHDYNKIGQFLLSLESDQTILLDPVLTSVYIQGMIKVNIKEIDLPAKQLKAIKNDTELKHIENAMIKDGVALTKAFLWLENTLKERKVREYEFASKLAECRGTQKDYKGESFNAIVGYNSNGAIIHYSPSRKGSAEIDNKGILLCDSGGQYLDGTTDITRTIALSPPSVDIQKHYTLVLKGHINLASAVFPEGTRGIQLDALTRQYLWRQGLDYGHGTGHGVGFFLNVHEPYQGFTAHLDERGKSIFHKGMLTSNEPGYYLEGEYGIRIENLIVCTPSEKYEGFLRHRTITLFPIDTQLLYIEWMTEADIKWLNAYHRKVKRLLSPFLNDEEREWMEKKCTVIELAEN